MSSSSSSWNETFRCPEAFPEATDDWNSLGLATGRGGRRGGTNNTSV